jgi:GNAT superfamily N-acetyltransferase
MFQALLAERAGRALGVAVYFPEFSTLRGQPGVYLQDLYLAPDARAIGLGRRLIGAVVRNAAEWHAGYLRLATHTDNEVAMAFYERLGFRGDPREKALMLDGKYLTKLGNVL